MGHCLEHCFDKRFLAVKPTVLMTWLTFNRALMFAQSLKSIVCGACADVINEDEQEDIHEERGNPLLANSLSIWL